MYETLSDSPSAKFTAFGKEFRLKIGLKTTSKAVTLVFSLTVIILFQNSVCKNIFGSIQMQCVIQNVISFLLCVGSTRVLPYFNFARVFFTYNLHEKRMIELKYILLYLLSWNNNYEHFKITRKYFLPNTGIEFENDLNRLICSQVIQLNHAKTYWIVWRG